MRYLLFLFLLLPITLLAQDFPYQREIDTIPVTIGNWQPYSPWCMGSSASQPSFGDLDGDGDYDLIVGQFMGCIYYYQNTGSTQQPYLLMQTETLAGIDDDRGWVSPVLIDIDNDGDLDLFYSANGPEHFYRNDGSVSTFNFSFITDSIPGLIGSWGLFFIDFDADGDYDLFAGQGSGHICYYENTGSPTNFEFTLVTDYFSNIDVGTASDPVLCDIDDDGDYDLFIGELNGHLWYYRNDGTPQQYNFTLVSNYWLGIYVVEKAASEFCDIDGDGDYDLFVGREPNLGDPTHGDVFYYENVGTAQNPDFQFVTANYLTADVGYYANEQLIDLDHDGDLDLLVGSGHHIQYYKNIGSSLSPAFFLEDTAFAGIDLIDIQPFFCDIDADGDYDLFAGTTAIPGPPGMRLYLNQGTPQHSHFVLYSENFVPGNYFVIIVPTLADIDADGDLDLFITDHQGHYFYYENTGTPQWPTFQFVTDNWQGLNGNIDYRRFLRFYDIDHDGDLDLFFFNNWNEPGGSNLRFYRNVGTPQNPSMVLVTRTFFPCEVIEPVPEFCDIDGDSLTDIFVGDLFGGILFFHGVDTTGVAPFNPYSVPKDISLSLFPNPSNAGAVVRFTLPGAGLVRVGLFDVEGRVVGAHCVRPVGEAGGFQGARSAPLQETWFPAGTHDLRLDAKDLPSGVYLIRLDTGQQRVTGKVVVVK
ncbi:MAG: T9SS type A sorting domain-containing protein [bacterium]|nr:T9SS type A sorting domain-containing protein [bacterium]